ncbi:diguanylate cyclase/phosphodiesterase (GGDEF & EAL domains) with PAS/PAC sensor(s) [hydrothermal vent metagenome]|uniref:Diguanylate cyclase/phosphodiesterase (GGDEF & EAL domains) with PAS/PAC sensor(S) n=1 Tax=hydrothermal vent metagenome TaxID=652676 RepID=A0A3B0YWQ5_9ZZZZ
MPCSLNGVSDLTWLRLYIYLIYIRLYNINNTLHQRRLSDASESEDRRRHPDRRAGGKLSGGDYRYPSWQEQNIQYLARFVFLMLGIGFFNFTDGIEPTLWSNTQLNTAFAIYFIAQTLLCMHAARQHVCPTRYHIAMWIDIAAASISVLNDPYAIPPSLLVYIMIVLGNGMRYGMRLFAVSLVGCFSAAMIVLTLRYVLSGAEISPGLIFLNLFGGIILVYSYVLMGRIEHSRNELEQSSNIDTLTGLMNRRALQDIASAMFLRLQNNPQKFVLLFADLDKFKVVNDELGHAAGDLVLREFARIVHRSIRESDVAARYGGDEFIIILEDTTLDHARLIAERIQKQVVHWSDENEINFSVTFGLGEAPTHGDNFEHLLDQVDKALYRSKSTHTGGGLAVVGKATQHTA